MEAQAAIDTLHVDAFHLVGVLRSKSLDPGSDAYRVLQTDFTKEGLHPGSHRFRSREAPVWIGEHPGVGDIACIQFSHATREIDSHVLEGEVVVIVVLERVQAELGSICGKPANVVPVHQGFATTVPGIFAADATNRQEDRPAKATFAHGRGGMFFKVGVGVIEGQQDRSIGDLGVFLVERPEPCKRDGLVSTCGQDIQLLSKDIQGGPSDHRQVLDGPCGT